ncbi:MAG: chaperone modulator CbpM [Coprobacter sp.]|nr:chaperone modulator CbpM [Coprobacter sp.]
MPTDFIIISEYCRNCRIEPSFIGMLEAEGLIQVHTVGGERYLALSQLRELEQYARMYYDLSINIEGIDTIRHLLERIKTMQRELAELKSRLRLVPPDRYCSFE